jgi:hypothetical protein
MVAKVVHPAHPAHPARTYAVTMPSKAPTPVRASTQALAMLEHVLLPLARRNGIRVCVKFDSELESPAIRTYNSALYLRRGSGARFLRGECGPLAVLHPVGVRGRKKPMLFLSASAVMDLGMPDRSQQTLAEFTWLFQGLAPVPTVAG